MLVLGRKESETITIPTGGPMVIKVLEIRNGRVKLGFDADPSINIVRTEVLQLRGDAPCSEKSC